MSKKEIKPRGYWTKEKCLEEALNFNTRKEFQIKSSSAYSSAQKNRWLDEICAHMNSFGTHWTKELCQQEALLYESRSKYQKGSSASYQVSYKNGWLDEICSHMSIKQKKDVH